MSGPFENQNIAVIHLKVQFHLPVSYFAPHHAFAKMQSTRVEFVLIMRGVFRCI